jgi:hypothetical protein
MALKQHKIALVIPSTQNVHEAASAETVARWLRTVKTRFAQWFGGFTAHSAVGGWVSPVHGLVEEPVTVVSSYTTQSGLTCLAEVKALASQMAEALAQEAVAVEVDHCLQFVKK